MATPRNFSPQEMFIRFANEHVPAYAFHQYKGTYSEWKAECLPRVLETLGRWPQTVPAKPEMVAEWMDRGIRKRRYVIDVSTHLSASVQVNLPADLLPGERRPAIQCWHGHGPFGKAPVMGNRGPQEINENIESMNYDYGHQMATHGFITYAIDWMGHGEQNERLKPHFRSVAEGRDWCNLYYLHATMFGMTSLSINLAHGRAATDFVTTLPEVDAGQLGVMGLSGGGTMCLWTALTDSRFKAAEIICYSDRWARFGINDINYCGMQIAPGLYQWVDLPDLQGLLAPLPLLVDIGANDECFHVDNAINCYQELEAIYQAAGAKDHLHLDLFPGQHSWGGNRSVGFFNSYLCR
jgi:dienelactone hydrolase